MNRFNYIVFLDADKSIFNVKVKYSFLEYFLLETLPAANYAHLAYEKFLKNMNRNILRGVPPSIINRNYYKNFSGMPNKLMYEIGYSWYYKSKLELKENFLNQNVLYEIAMHKKNNAQIVLLSCSFLPCLEPLLDELECSSVICTDLEIINGYYSGNIIYDPIFSEGKTKAIKNFMTKQNENKEEKINNFVRQNEIESSFCDIAFDYKEDILNFYNSDKFRSLYRN